MNLKKQLFSYSAVNILNAAIPFLLLPVLTRYLSTSEYGTLSLIQIIITLCFPLMMLNSQSLIVIDKATLNIEQHKNLTAVIILISLLVFVAIISILIPLTSYLSDYLGVTSYTLYSIPLILLFQVLPNTLTLYFQANKKPVDYGKVKLLLSALNMLLSIIFVALIELSWQGRLLGIMTAYMIITLFCSIYIYRQDFFRNITIQPYLKNAARYGVPLMPHTIAGILLSMADKFLITGLLGKQYLGIYSVGFQIGMAVSILMSSINQAWAPHMYGTLNNLTDNITKKKLIKKIYKLMMSMLLITLLYITFVPLVFKIFIDEKFAQAIIYAQIIGCAFMFQGWYFLMANFIFYNKQSSLLSLNTLSALTISVILNFLLIPRHGLLGASVSMLIVYFYLFISVWALTTRHNKMPWMLKE